MKIGSLEFSVPSSFSVPSGREVVEGIAKITVIALSAMTVNAKKDENCVVTQEEAGEIKYAVGAAAAAATLGLYAWLVLSKTDWNPGH